MRTITFDGIEYKQKKDYRRKSPMRTRVTHMLVDKRNGIIVAHGQMNSRERNRERKLAHKVGEYCLQWLPCLV